MPFANAYDFGGPSRFRNTIPAPVTGRAGELCLAIGELGRSGLAVLLGTDGEARWSHTYTMSEGPISFHDGVVVGSGPGHGFVLLSGASGQDYVLVRLDADGQLIWTQRIRTDWTRDVVRVVPLTAAPGQEEFLLLGWGRQAPGAGPNVVEMIRVRADGTALRSAHLRLRTDDRIVDALPFGDGYALVGHSVRLPESSGFLVYLSATLGVARAWHLTGNDLRALALHAALLEPGRLWVVGRAGTATGQMSMIAEVTADGADLLVDARVLSLSDNFDQPTRIAAVGNDLLLFDQPVGFVRPPTVVRFDRNLDANARYGFEFTVGVELHGLAVARNQTVLIAGVARERPGQGQALMLATDVALHCCGTKTLPPPLPEKIAVTVSDATATATVIDVDMTIPGASVVVANATPSVRSLCRVIEALPDQMVQSPFLALQSAGSSGVDATRGILLRWHLLGVLGESHLAKGTLAHNTFNFNKPDDFVTIYRAPWPGGALRERRVSFAADKPVYVDHPNRLLVFETGTDTPRDLLHVSFLDAAAYLKAKAAFDPGQDVAGFLADYGAHPIEIELRHRLAVACDLSLTPAGAAYSVQAETLGVGENRPLASKVVTSRRVLGPADGPTPRLFAENTRSVRVAVTGARLDAVAFRCYDDVLAHVNQAKDWTLVGRFALTLDRPTAFLRLEDPARTPVHGQWWKFNDGAFVNVKNYRDRWEKSADGLEAAVQEYVTRSEQDPKATAVVPGVLLEDGAISFSYLDWLQIAAVDYHVARMLGLGHIDVDVDANTSYVYVAEYVTRGDLDDGGGVRDVQHLYMSLPTTLAQSRLPIVPDLPPVEYGLSVPTANGAPYRLTDAGGYTADGMVRYIRLYPDCAQLYDAGASQGFFDSAATFDLAERSLPVLYGVEYRKDGKPTWSTPEIGHDTVYEDTAVPPVFEAMPTPFPPVRRASAFIHKETEPGIHEYAVYGINIFSRASALSQVQPTDETRFRKANRLLPPSDLRVQLIQEESPLVLTTDAEQQLLAGLTSPDRTLVRLTCNHAHVQDANWEFADTIEILFRSTVPSNVIGAVKAVVGVPSNPDAIRIETEPYTYPSTLETVEPVLLFGERENFLGGALVAGNQRYTIIDVTWPDATTGKDPIFLVSKTTTPGVTETAAGPALIIADVAAAITPGSLVMAVENMAAARSWGLQNPLTAKIRIGDASWKKNVESFTRSDGTKVMRELRGVWENADVTVSNGLYTIAFDNYVLGDHPQVSDADTVNWHKGIVRISVVGRPVDDRRALAVLTSKVDQSSGKFTLTAVDDTKEPGAILTEPQLVNYYPGYKMYLHADPAKGFEQTSVMPAPGDGSRMTMLGVRSIDNSTHDDAGDAYHSPVGIPQLLTAIEVVAPEEPDKPTGLKYATPPDTEGKSSFTLTTTFKHAPFAAVFYRVDALTVLRALYSAQTVQDIRAKIFPPEKDAFFAKRWEEVFKFASYPATIDFTAFPLDGGTYALPHPDATRFKDDATTTLDQLADKIKQAVLGLFLPLTEQPLIYGLIRSDSNYVPTNKPQRFRNDNGDVLRPGDEGFDLAPMALRFDQGTPTIRFTDFTLDGSMNPHTVYFYAVREISNQMKIGEASEVFGPVRLVNLSPPAAPVLRKISTAPYDVLAARNPEVRFEILPPSAVDPIAKIRMYRTTTALDATTVRTMALVKEVDVTTLLPTADPLIVVDDFAGAFVPYGDPLFYRLVFVRAVAYEDAGGAHVAYAASEPTRVLLASLIDIVNPRPPVPTVSRVSITANGDKLLRLTWSKTVHNGTYYVSRLAASGNWMRLGRLKTNAESVTFDLPEPLPVNDEDGNRIYYRFEVNVENSSGLLNLVEAPITTPIDAF